MYVSDVLDEEFTEYEAEFEQALIAHCLNGETIVPDGFYNSWDGGGFIPHLSHVSTRELSPETQATLRQVADKAYGSEPVYMGDRDFWESFDWDAFIKWAEMPKIRRETDNG